MVWLGPSQGHRRLRFSFQINDVKDPTAFRRPHCLAPVAGGGGYLLAGLFRVNRSFQTFLPRPGSPVELPKFGAKITAGLRGTTPKRGSDSIGARENTHPLAKSKRKVPLPNRLGSAPPEREAAI
jgi:hypothetical protein